MPKRSHFGTVYRRKGGWCVRWTEGGTRRHRSGFATRAQAEAFRAARMMEREAAGGTPRGGCTVAVLLEAVRPHQDARSARSTRAGRVSLRRHVCLVLGDRTADELRPIDVERALVSLRVRAGLGPKSVNLALQVLSAAYRDGGQLGIVTTNPCRGVRLPKAPDRAVPFVSDADVDRILLCAPAHARDALAVLFDTGLRLAEYRGLTWRDVGTDRLNVVGKGGKHRVVPLTDRAAGILARRRAARVVPLYDVDPVFATPGPKYLRLRLREACAKAGVPRLRLHDCRHAFASRLVQAGVDLPTVQRLLGHASIQMTMRYAAHAPEDAASRAVRMLGGQASSSGATPSTQARKRSREM